MERQSHYIKHGMIDPRVVSMLLDLPVYPNEVPRASMCYKHGLKSAESIPTDSPICEDANYISYPSEKVKAEYVEQLRKTYTKEVEAWEKRKSLEQ